MKPKPVYNKRIMKKAPVTNNEIQQEKSIQKAFQEGMFLFPETPEDVAEFEKKFGSTDIILPDELQEPTFITSKRKESIKKSSTEIKENFAMAAREGSSVPKDILKSMKEHRDKARQKKKK